MGEITSVGFPRMMKEAGEKRVFLPEFIEFFAKRGIKVFIEEGYGSRAGFSFSQFKHSYRNVYMCSHEEAYQQDLVIVLRSPTMDEYSLIKPGAILFSMLHFPTRPTRVARLQELGIRAISMDSVTNDTGIRLVENMHAVAWNGLEAAFDVLEKTWPGLQRPGQPFRALILGTGMVGKYAVEAATKLGFSERNSQHMQAGGPGSIAISIGRNLTSQPALLEKLFNEADILVDATQRRNVSKPVVPNEWIAWLPEHAVVTDLAVDPYTLHTDPPVVRGVEGIPQGSLDQYIFMPDDPNWTATIPESIPTTHRRPTVTCYSWPGIHPETCMRHYAAQVEPLMEALLDKGYEGLSLEGSYFERALYRATLKGWLENADYRPVPR